VRGISDFYNRVSQYDSWMQELEDRNRLWARRIRKMRKHRVAGSLLDIGAGIGQFLNVAKPEYNAVQGTEVSATAIQHAKKLYGLEILQGTIESLPIAEQFENVTAFHVLEHVHWPFAFLKRCYQLLKPGGRLFLAVPNDLEMLSARLGRSSLTPIRFPITEIHLSHFTSKSLAKLLRSSGFEVLDLSLDPFWVVPYSLELRRTVRYLATQALCRITGVNVYPTIWAVGEKRAIQ
jgi:2-polyprenyl-3-methyl-5-hydroxy-6-metoxy-1,4-benzoquinol methylase